MLVKECLGIDELARENEGKQEAQAPFFYVGLHQKLWPKFRLDLIIANKSRVMVGLIPQMLLLVGVPRCLGLCHFQM